MVSYKVGITQALYNLNRTSKTLDSLTHQLSTGKKINAPKDDPVEWVKANRSRAVFNDLQAINSGLNTVAMSVRVADMTMAAIGEHIDQMKAQLGTIVQDYATLPPGSPERGDILNSFNELRTLIDQLAMPPEDHGARKIMADPALVPEAGDWEILINEHGFRKTIHSQEVHTGLTGLNIPSLLGTATNAEIESAIVNLDTARDTLIQRRTVLATDTLSIKSSQEQNTRRAERNRSYAEKLESADALEVAVKLKSEELQHTLTIESIRSLTDAQTRFLQFL